MKKALLVLAAIVSMGFIATTTYAASGEIDQADNGMVTIDCTNMINAGDVAANLEFQPSTNVILSGASSSTSFAAATYHEQVEDKDGGRQYGMAADTNVIFWLNISEDGNGQAVVDVAATTSAVFPLADWNTL